MKTPGLLVLVLPGTVLGGTETTLRVSPEGSASNSGSNLSPVVTLPRAASNLPAVSLARFGLQLDQFRRELLARDMKLFSEGDTRRKAFDSQQDVDAYKRR